MLGPMPQNGLSCKQCGMPTAVRQDAVPPFYFYNYCYFGSHRMDNNTLPKDYKP